VSASLRANREAQKRRANEREWTRNISIGSALTNNSLESPRSEHASIAKKGATSYAPCAHVHLHLGFASFAEYIERLFGYSPRWTEERLRVAESLETLPHLQHALHDGSVPWSTVRELIRVATPKSENAWLEASRGRTLRQVEQLVAGHKPGDQPDAPSDPSLRRHVLRMDVTAETFATFREGPPNLYQKLSSGMGEEEPLFKSPVAKLPADWSRDGNYLLCSVVDVRTKWDLWVLSLSGERRWEIFLQTPNNEQLASFAPSGRWIAYDSDESGKKEVYVRSFPASGAQWQVSAGGGSQPRFRRDGKELFYMSADRKVMAVQVKTDANTFDSGAPRALFETRVLMKDGNQYAVTSDGQRFLINSTMTATGANPINIVVNWTAKK
jgi:hypothetical protein